MVPEVFVPYMHDTAAALQTTILAIVSVLYLQLVLVNSVLLLGQHSAVKVPFVPALNPINGKYNSPAPLLYLSS
jgi:hypothetical protein